MVDISNKAQKTDTMKTTLRVLVAAQTLEKTAARLFTPHGLTPAQFNVLNLLADQEQGMRASDLARELIVDPSNVTGLLKRMAIKGWLTDLANDADRRQRIVGLTAKGKARWSKAHADYSAALEKIEQTMSERERASMEKTLSRIVEEAGRL